MLPKNNILKAGVKEVIVKKVMTDDAIAEKQGHNFTEEGITIYDEDIDIYIVIMVHPERFERPALRFVV